jgi:phage tail sheath gpL-like
VFIDGNALPVQGFTERLVCASVDTLPNTESQTSTPAAGVSFLNDPRVECLWMQNSDVPPCELAAAGAAVYSLMETPPLSAQGINYDGFGNDLQSQNLWNIPAPKDGTSASATSIQTAITSGVTPIKAQRGGRTSIVKRVTSYCYLPGSSPVIQDFRITDAGKVTICDYFGDQLKQLLVTTYPRKLIANDPLPGQPPPGPNVVTPGMVGNLVLQLGAQFAASSLIDLPTLQQGLIVQRETTPNSRISISAPLLTATPLHIIAGLVNQVG